MDATAIHLTDIPPTACAACYGQYPDRRHIDFGAAYDGPVLNAGAVVAEGATPQPIDDLVLCEDCVRMAAKLVGMVDGDAVSDIERLSDRLVEERARADAAEEHAADLTRALASKPEPEAKPETKPRQKTGAAR